MKDYILQYKSPAEHSNQGWQNEVLPIGNAYMGMCIFGGTNTEFLQFNEKTLWAGGPSPKRPNYNGGNIEGSYNTLKKIQSLLEKGETSKVNAIRNDLVGSKDGYGNYLNFGEIKIEFGHTICDNYRRSLDLNNAVAMVKYSCDGVDYSREYFASYPDRVIVTKLTASRSELSFKISFDIEQKGYKIKVEDNSIVASGSIEDNNLQYYAKLAIVCDGTIAKDQNCLFIDNAKNCEIYLSAATDYAQEFPKYRGSSPMPIVDNIIDKAVKKGFEAIKQSHLDDYKNLFDRVNFDLGAAPTDIETDKLIKEYKSTQKGNDARYFEEILFAYGRYLIISSSRKGTLPANLQGVWNNSNTPAWGCDYHLNVNLQMCYWHAFVANLAETAIPMLEYMQSLREPGRITAKEYHNIISTEANKENGWVCHTQCTPFGWTCPGWEFDWGWSPAASSWMMQNCFDYYVFTQDKKILKEMIYPMMKENANFWLQNLIYEKSQDRMVSSPSYSPEHGPISVGNTYEQEMVWILFNDTIKAAEIVGGEEDFANTLRQIMPKLSPLNIGKWGQIKEWYEEDEWYKNVKRRKRGYKSHNCQHNHRHASHLIGLYPTIHITKETPDLFSAAKISLLDRGVGGKLMTVSGWGKANRINMWARLKDGDEAYKMIMALLTKNIADNLWDLHPPFQMDGNCGYTSGVCEMLVYSNGDYIELLPSLPSVWKNGSINGICARGNYIVDLIWCDGKVTQFEIKSSMQKAVVVKFDGKDMIVKTNNAIKL